MKILILAGLLINITLPSSAAEVSFSKAIKKEFRERIGKDLEILNNFTFKETPTQKETLNLLGLDHLSSETANHWLEERVKYIIEENAFSKIKLTLKKSLFVERENVTFPFQNIIPYALDGVSDAPEKVNAKEVASTVIMSNAGAALYMKGKNEHKVYGLKISRGLLKSAQKISIDSPRAGIIQIGAGLFDSRFNINNQNLGAVANALHRLSILFHEARHSDGRGKSVVFAHAICPPGHDLEGQPGCDETQNGAYAIGSSIMLEMIKSCGDDCNEREKEILKMIYLDNKNRILPKTHKNESSTFWDDRPEGL
ncbi:MAG: hypothetical protein K2Q18_07990 [Bdellovibrionales bacterium]|nr:hypothetical protein [Bdellovibrionales bacterium]